MERTRSCFDLNNARTNKKNMTFHKFAIFSKIHSSECENWQTSTAAIWCERNANVSLSIVSSWSRYWIGSILTLCNSDITWMLRNDCVVDRQCSHGWKDLLLHINFETNSRRFRHDNQYGNAIFLFFHSRCGGGIWIRLIWHVRRKRICVWFVQTQFHLYFSCLKLVQ